MSQQRRAERCPLAEPVRDVVQAPDGPRSPAKAWRGRPVGRSAPSAAPPPPRQVPDGHLHDLVDGVPWPRSYRTCVRNLRPLGWPRAFPPSAEAGRGSRGQALAGSMVSGTGRWAYVEVTATRPKEVFREEETFAGHLAGARALGRGPGIGARLGRRSSASATGQEEVQLRPRQRERGKLGAADHAGNRLGRALPDGRLRPRELRREESRRRLIHGPCRWAPRPSGAPSW